MPPPPPPWSKHDQNIGGSDMNFIVAGDICTLQTHLVDFVI